MSTRLRLSVLLSAVVIVALLAAWVVTGRAVLHPFARDILRTHLDQVVYVADELHRGVAPSELSERLGLRVKLRPRPAQSFNKNRARDKCRTVTHRGVEMLVCRRPRLTVIMPLDGQYLVVTRPVEIDQPERQVGLLLFLVALAVVALSSLLAFWVSRPIETSVQAMERIASGDFSHRLTPGGPRELSEVARAFNRMADRVQSLLQSEKQLMAGLSHELRTPLARLRLETELLRDQGASARRMDAMEQDLLEMDGLLTELFNHSRLSLGRSPYRPERLNLLALIKARVEKFRESEEIEVTVLGTSADVLGDRDALSRSVDNLLGNANRHGSPPIEVRVDGPRVTVRDHGSGVDPKELDQLFAPFFRGRGAGPKGVGLGLAYVKEVVAQHGGSVFAECPQDGGLAIGFELPEAMA
jgi:two-component system, OmpR family, sensor kinase